MTTPVSLQSIIASGDPLDDLEKTHMVYELDDARMRRFEELFIEPEWLQEPHLVGFDPKTSANPFKAFEQIPPRSRYMFLLDSSHYVIMTFIHAPSARARSP